MKRAIVAIAAILLALTVVLAGAIWYAISRVRDDSVPIVSAPSETNTPIPEMYVLDVDATPALPEETAAPIYETPQADADIINVLLVGGDSRSKTTDAIGNSDTIMLLSINRDTNTITLLSFMRDSWVDIVTSGGTRKGKLNAAHASGGYGALINTINANFGLDVQDYIAVGFQNFTDLIDAVGGVDVDLTAKEAYYINWKMDRRVLEAVDGVAHLDGEQALWYARNRTTPLAGDESGNDFSRVTRQQHLIELVLAKVRSEMNMDMMIDLIRFMVDNCSTNMPTDRMGEIGGFLLANECEIVKDHVPFAGTWSYRQAGGISFDVAEAAARIHALLYPDAEPGAGISGG